MNLTIDIGNSLVKVGLFDNDDLIEALTYDSFSTDELTSLITKHHPKRAIISSVGDRKAAFDKLLSGLSLFIKLSHETPLPITNKYETPKTLGNDRLALVVGANKSYPGEDALVIDTGTSITYDFINSNGEYLGGSISPGLDMRFKALNTFTERLPLIKPAEPEGLVGRSTEASILSGVVDGTASEIDGMIEQYKSAYPDVKVLVTGGNLNFFESRLKNQILALPNLLLQGLNHILNHNARLSK